MDKYTGEKPSHISPSQIETGECLYAYMRLRLKQDIENDNMPMRIGRAIHKMVYSYTKYCKENNNAGDPLVLDEIVKKLFAEYNLVEKDYDSIKKSMVMFAEKNEGHIVESTLDIEKMEEIIIGQDDEGKDIKIKFVMDRVGAFEIQDGNVIEFLDYKNQYNILPDAELQNHKQLNIYQYLGCKYLYPGFKFTRKGIWYLRHGIVKWTEFENVGDLQDQFNNTEEYIIRQWNRLINREEYPPEKCDYCFKYGGCTVMLAGECPLYSEKEVEKLKTGSIEDKVYAYRKMQLDLKLLKPEIKEYFNDHEGIEVDGKFVGLEISDTYSYVLEKFLKYAKKYEIDLREFTLTKTAVEKAINKSEILPKVKNMNKEYTEELDDMKLKSASTKFKI